MDTASLELSKELYALSGWEYASHQHLSPYDDSHPVYDLGYLMRKLPDITLLIKVKGMYAANVEWVEKSREQGWSDMLHWHTPTADTPEDAACKLAIQLFEYGFFKRE